MCRENWGSNSACWFNALMTTMAVSSIDNDEKRRVTRAGKCIHLVLAFVNVNSRDMVLLMPLWNVWCDDGREGL